MFNSVTVVIVDDHFVVRQGVRALLETLPDISSVNSASLIVRRPQSMPGGAA
jgi:DNA-binding NarL/FixJ family response regulator